MLLSDPERERGGLGGGVPMFARTFNEFMLWSGPCTGWLHLASMRLGREGRKGGRKEEGRRAVCLGAPVTATAADECWPGVSYDGRIVS